MQFPPTAQIAATELPVVDQALRQRYAERYQRVSRVMSAPEWELALPLIAAIDALKAERKACILAHNYQTPDIYHGVADITGDSLALAQHAADSDADVIVMCGVHFMAETAKLLNPERTVIIPDLEAGCSLATSITAADVRALRKAHPNVPVVAYVNTTAAVKAEVDICCTSANAVETVEALGVPRVIFLPDGYLARYVAAQTDVEVIPWEGRCEVHERFTAAEVDAYREASNVYVLAHPECSPEVLDTADFVGSTSGMIAHVRQKRPERVLLLTECSMSDNVSTELPEVDFVRPCNLCPHMKRIDLTKLYVALRDLQPTVEIPPAIAQRARHAVQRMLDIRQRKVA